MFVVAAMSLFLQAAPAAKPSAPPPAPKVASNQRAARAPAAAPKAGRTLQGGMPHPADLICGYETPTGGAISYVCRTQPEIDAVVKAGGAFSLTKPGTPFTPATAGR